MNGAGRVRPKVPAHRVVNRNGILCGKHHFTPPGNMEKLLKKEGIKVKNDQVVDFKKLFWDPVTGIRILILHSIHIRRRSFSHYKIMAPIIRHDFLLYRFN